MPGRHINDHQMRLYMKYQIDAIDRRRRRRAAGDEPRNGATASSRTPDCPRRRQARVGGAGPIRWPTIFDPEVVPMLQAAPGFRPIAVFEEMQRRHPELSRASCAARWSGASATGARSTARSRRLCSVRCTNPVGWDCPTSPRWTTWAGRASQGVALDHRLYHFRLACSGFEHAHVILGGESYVALAEGLQNALWALGGAPREHRSDSLSAAFRNLDPRRARGSDHALRCAVRPLRHGTDPQQPRRRPRERLASKALTVTSRARSAMRC